MELIATIPAQLRNEKDIGKAKKTLEKILAYNWKLGKLIDAHQTTEHLNRLHACHVDNIPEYPQQQPNPKKSW